MRSYTTASSSISSYGTQMLQGMAKALAVSTTDSQPNRLQTITSRANSTVPASPWMSDDEESSSSPSLQAHDPSLLLSTSNNKLGTSSPWAQQTGGFYDSEEDLKGATDPREMRVFHAQQKEHTVPRLEELLPDVSLIENNNSEMHVEAILQQYQEYLQQKTQSHFGYPYNLNLNHLDRLSTFLRYSINNLGDPYIPSNYAIHSRPFECAVVDFFAHLFQCSPTTPRSWWGYVTTSGTEGNLHGILCAREALPEDAVLYTSSETHYSIFKAARYYRIPCVSVPTQPTGEMNYEALAELLDTSKPAIMNVNIGTTVKGAVDDVDTILQILQESKIPRERFYVHCDGALFALMLPFLQGNTLSFQKPIDSIAVSGHKMLGSPMPCGVVITRKEHVENLEQRIDYLNSVDTTIMGSRNGQAALYLWYNIKRKGIQGLKRDVQECMATAVYLRDRLRDSGFRCQLNPLSTTVVLERPKDENVVQRWQLACEEDIAHVVVMPNVTRDKIDRFIQDLIFSRNKHGSIESARPDSPLTKLSTQWDTIGDDSSVHIDFSENVR